MCSLFSFPKLSLCAAVFCASFSAGVDYNVFNGILYCLSDFTQNSTSAEILDWAKHNSSFISSAWAEYSTLLSSYYWGVPLLMGLPSHISGCLRPSYILILLAVVSGTLNMAPFWLSRSLSVSILCRVVQGAFDGLLLSLAIPLLHLLFPSRSGLLLGLNFASLSLGVTAGSCLAGWFCSRGVWRGAFYAAVALKAAPIFLILPNLKQATSDDEKLKWSLASALKCGPVLKRFWSLVFDRQLYFMSVSYFCLTAFAHLFILSVPLFLEYVLGIGLSKALLYAELPLAAVIIGRIITGCSLDWLRNVVGSKRALLILLTLVCSISAVLVISLNLSTKPSTGQVLSLITVISAVFSGYAVILHEAALVGHSTDYGMAFHSIMFQVGSVAPILIAYSVGIIVQSPTPKRWKIFLLISTLLLQGVGWISFVLAMTCKNNRKPRQPQPIFSLS